MAPTSSSTGAVSDTSRAARFSAFWIRSRALRKRPISNSSIPKPCTMRVPVIPSFITSTASPIFSWLRRLVALRRAPKRATG